MTDITYDVKHCLIDITLERGEDHIAFSWDEIQEIADKAKELFRA